MSKNRNRAKLNKAITSKETLIIERVSESYCLICNRRSGTHHWDCSPSNISAKHRHGSGKAIFNHKYREFRSWKHNRKTQYKQNE
jgi:hypothetical protein